MLCLKFCGEEKLIGQWLLQEERALCRCFGSTKNILI